MRLPNSEELNIGHLSKLFSNTSECYKLFWFKAIMSKLEEKDGAITFDELVNEMIVDAWYMVTEYHLNLGPKDALEAVVNKIAERMKFNSLFFSYSVYTFFAPSQLHRYIEPNLPKKLYTVF